VLSRVIYINKVSDAEQIINQWLLDISPPLPFEAKQDEVFQVAMRAPGAGKWLLGSQVFRDWKDGNLKRLWCHGIRKDI
jgi:hypothetical protein